MICDTLSRSPMQSPLLQAAPGSTIPPAALSDMDTDMAAVLALESNIAELGTDSPYVAKFKEPYQHWSRISEINTLISNSSFELILLPILKSLTQAEEDRWVTWISDDKAQFFHLREQLKRLDTRCLHLRSIYTCSLEDNLWTTWEALAQGNSQLVICQLSQLNSEQKYHLQSAAELGDCHLLNLSF